MKEEETVPDIVAEMYNCAEFNLTPCKELPQEFQVHNMNGDAIVTRKSVGERIKNFADRIDRASVREHARIVRETAFRRAKAGTEKSMTEFVKAMIPAVKYAIGSYHPGKACITSSKRRWAVILENAQDALGNAAQEIV